MLCHTSSKYSRDTVPQQQASGHHKVKKSPKLTLLNAQMKLCAWVPLTGIPNSLPASTFDVPLKPENQELKISMTDDNRLTIVTKHTASYSIVLDRKCTVRKEIKTTKRPTSNIAVFTGRQASVGSLCPTESEFEKGLMLAGRLEE